MSFKLFDMVETDVGMLSTEEMLISDIEQSDMDKEVSDVLNAIQVSQESMATLMIAIESAKHTLESNDVRANDVVNLRLVTANTSASVGLSFDEIDLGTESISDPVVSLELAIEEGQFILTKILNGVRKTFARFSNILLKYLGKIDTAFNSMFTNLNKSKMELVELEKKGLKLDSDTIGDDSFLKWRGMNLMGALGIGKMHDPVAGLKEMVKVYGDKGYIKKFNNAIVDMVMDDEKLTPIYGNNDALKSVERNLGKKIKNFFCKSTTNDRLIIGATGSVVFILERCKPLHLTAGFMPYHYSVINFMIPSVDMFGTPKAFKAPSYKDLYKMIDDGIAMTKNNSKMVNEIHDMMKIGSDSIAKIDDKAGWETGYIYTQLPLILLVLSKTYSEIPNMIGDLTKIFIREIKKQD